MKHLYLIGGTMGVGKTSACRELKRKLPGAVFLDGDWCWDADPFVVTDETKEMVLDNICHVLNNFLHCSAYENIIFCWVMHEQQILESVLEKLDTDICMVHVISLTCDEKTLISRLQKDIDAGVREVDVMERSLQRLTMYKKLNTEKLDTTNLSALEVANKIIEMTKDFV